jgi:hypothetical protein
MGAEGNEGYEVMGVKGRFEGSFHPSIPVSIGFSAYEWKDGSSLGKLLPIGETQSLPRQNAVTFEAKR